MGRKSWIVAATLASVMIAAPASADAIYTYTTADGAVLTINATTMTGSLIGATVTSDPPGAYNVNATFSGAGLAAFTGGSTLPSFTTSVTMDPTSTLSLAGETKVPATYSFVNFALTTYTSGLFQLDGLWLAQSPATCQSCLNVTSLSGSIASSSTGGGTSVPEPGMTGLMALAFIGIAYARHSTRKSHLAFQARAA